jgi:bifunctional DNA-binding transcriptional regulator/antitoxin component of YhaV-PrlF toxin-antitoxin module
MLVAEMSVSVGKKSVLSVPIEVQRRAGIKPGDRIEFEVSEGIIRIIPVRPCANEEYTPEQRKVIEARIAEGLDDIEHGRVHGPFNSHLEMMASLREPATAVRPKSRNRSRG